MSDHDDRQVGRILNRREILALFGAAGGALLLAGCTPVRPGGTAATSAANDATPSPAIPVSTTANASTATGPACIVRPEQTEGPYFVDEQLNRSDIRTDPSDNSVKEGVPMQLTFAVSQVGNGACVPLAGAMVDVWHCDALGVYSDVNDRSSSTVGQKFLRGYQVTDENGVAQFTTIYPGWYQGRTVHIHFKIRTDEAAGQRYEFTSQLYFDDALSDQIYAQPPYASKGERTVRNADDGIYRNGGEQLLLAPSATDQGYASTFAIGLNIG